MTSLTTSQRVGRQTPRIKFIPEEYNPRASEEKAQKTIDLYEIATGSPLDEWQQSAVRYANLLRDDGKFACTEAAIIASRQQGKGEIAIALMLQGLFIEDCPLAVFTSHEFRTAQAHFHRVLGIIQNSKPLMDKVKKIRTADGEESIEAYNTQGTVSKLSFMARSLKSGRGLTGMRIFLDEAFALKPTMMASLLSTLSAQSLHGNPQLIYTSSAPLVDSEILLKLRDRGIKKEGDRLTYIEWSAKENADPDDIDTWYEANPGLGLRLSEDFVKTERGGLSAADFKRERLGIPESLGGAALISTESWNDLFDEDAEFVTQIALAVDVPPDRSSAVICFAGYFGDDLVSIGIIDQREGTSWVPKRLEELKLKWNPQAIIIDPGSAANSLIDPVKQTRVKPQHLATREYAASCGNILDLIENGKLRHPNQKALNDAIESARKKKMGDTGMFYWNRKTVMNDISPLVAATLALHGLYQKRKRSTDKQKSSGKSKVLVM